MQTQIISCNSKTDNVRLRPSAWLPDVVITSAPKMCHLRSLTAILVIVLSTGCENYVSSIPDMPVSLQLNLLTEYPHLQYTPGQYAIIDRPTLMTDRIGFGGIVVVATANVNSQGRCELQAFDLACPHEARADIRIEPDETGHAICHECGEMYDLLWGSGLPQNGISNEPLKHYTVRVSGETAYVSLR